MTNNYTKSTASLEGFLTRDPKISKSKVNTDFASLSVATRDRYYDEKTNDWKNKDTVFHNNILVFRKKVLENVRELKKGDLVNLSGRLSYNSFKGEDGFNHDEAKIIVTNIQKLDFKKGAE